MPTRLPANIFKTIQRQSSIGIQSHLYTSMASAPIPPHENKSKAKDWSASQYLKFVQQRTRPVHDLISQVPLTSPRRIVDIGCGPGNSTEALVARYPDAHVSGIDSSPNMVETARKALPGLQFDVADLNTYTPDEPVDLLFSNAVFQWLAYDDRISVIKRLLESLKPGGVFAMQIPDNFTEHSHESMRAVAEKGPWAEILRSLKPAREAVHSPQQLYDALKPLCSSVDLWHTHYQHPMENHQGIVEWLKGTGLRPFLDPLDPEQREGFLAAYLQRIKSLYPESYDGSVLLRFPRLFMVAVRA